MVTGQDILFDDIVAGLAQTPKRDRLTGLSDRQLSNLILVVRESQTELDNFIQAIQALQVAREDERIEASTVVS